MNNLSNYKTAHELTRKKRYSEARIIFEQILDQQASGAPESAYSLGLLYQMGHGVPSSMSENDRYNLAENYYTASSEMGYQMGTYRLGALHQKRGDIVKALGSFRAVAAVNPSAAYWAFRILADKSSSTDEGADAELYLQLAASQGHVLAQRIIAMRFLKGQEGISKIPHGLVLFSRMLLQLSNVVNKDEKLKYT